MSGFVHTYYSTVYAVRHLKSIDEVTALMDQARDGVLSSSEYAEATLHGKEQLFEQLASTYAAFSFGQRRINSESWLYQAKQAGYVYTLQGSGYPSLYFLQGKHVLPQLQLEKMKNLEDWLRPAALPEPEDWVYINEWDQS